MKCFPSILAALLVTASSSFATVWHAVSFSATIYGETQTGVIKPTVVNNRSIIAAVVASNNNTIPASDMVIAVLENNGTVAVIRKSTGVNLTDVIALGNTLGTVNNTSSSDVFVSHQVTISVPQAAFNGVSFAHFKSAGVKLTSAGISFTGGASTLVIKGSVATTAKRYSF